MAQTIGTDEILPFDIDGYKMSAVIEVLGRAYYYEWNEHDQQWSKLNERDPEAPDDLPTGKFDGQIIEVPRIA